MSGMTKRIGAAVIVAMAGVAGLAPEASMTATAAGAAFTCPTPGAVIGTPVVLDTWKDKKGGTWTLTCTNQSTTGDFVWTYKAAGASEAKVIGRCVYVGGRNNAGIVPGPDGNDDYWWHTCFNPTPNADGKFEAIIDIFCKNECKHTRRYMEYCDGAWVEVDRRDTTAGEFESFDPTDANDDGFSDENLDWWTQDLYGPGAAPPLPAEYESIVRFVPQVSGPETVILWDPGVLPFEVLPGEVIRFDDLDPTMVVWSDPRFSLVPTPLGLELHPMLPVPPLPGEALLVLEVPFPIETHWTISDPNAFNLVNNAFALPDPLHLLMPPVVDPEMVDLPLMGLSAGEIGLGPVVPACPGDATGDGIVDFDDLNAVLANWQTPGPSGDVDGSGFVDFDDLNLVLSNWGTVCGPATD